MKLSLLEYQKKIEEFVNTLGSEIISAIPDEWENTVAAYFVTEGLGAEHVKLCINTNNPETFRDLTEESWLNDEYDDIILEIQELFRQLRENSIDMGDVWSHATLILHPNKAFSIDFEYEPIKEFDSNFLQNWKNNYAQ